MFWKVGAALLVSLAVSRSSPSEGPKCACPFIYSPVCGSDGVTYDNDCVLKCVNPSARLEYRGTCGNKAVPCTCGTEDEPVCGTNHRTYINPCDLECDKHRLPNLALKHFGACKEKRNAEKECPCLISGRPVCASDGKTYESMCEMRCRNPEATVEYHAECGKEELPPCVCNDSYAPVCGSNDRTYPSECDLNCDKPTKQNLTLKHTGACKDKRSVEPKLCACPFISRPLCASDGQTYDSDCMMKCYNPEATVEYYGACGHREPPPCECKYVDSPVCGSNDRTYPSECDLNCDKRNIKDLALKHTGACKEKRGIEPKQCACPFISHPVCGSDGVTYDNPCMLRCQNPVAKLDYFGRCGQREIPCVCTADYDPVCGTNDRTYPNACVLKCDRSTTNLAVKHAGVCKTKRSAEPRVCGCPFINRPVCGSDGVTYDNECMLKCNNPAATLDYFGRCGKREIPCVCTADYDPVCGTNDRTYPNACVLKCDRSIPYLAVKHAGVCKTKRSAEPRVCGCPFISRPVCASDGRTYDTDCEMRCQNSDLKVLYEGPCKSKRLVADPCFCPYNLDPVCGSDGKTYDNPCVLGCEKFRSKQENLHITHTGKCRSKRSTDLTDCNCPLRILHELCGTDGNTYPNDCFLECAMARQPTLEKAYEGRCGKPVVPCEDCSNAGHQRVCGTNDRSYPNDCVLNCDKINGQPNLTVAHVGDCKQKRSVERECICPLNNYPICGSDGVTYPNDCMMKCQSPDLKVAYTGPCKVHKRSVEREVVKVATPTLCNCPARVKKEVCGTDGVTYVNDCFLACAQCRQPALAEAHKGPCEDKVSVVEDSSSTCLCISRILREVCGTDGVTYVNDCFFDCAKSKNTDLEKAHLGPCDTVAVVGV